MYGRCHTHLIQFDLMNRRILGEEYKLYKYLLHSCLLVLTLIDVNQQSVKVNLSIQISNKYYYIQSEHNK